MRGGHLSRVHPLHPGGALVQRADGAASGTVVRSVTCLFHSEVLLSVWVCVRCAMMSYVLQCSNSTSSRSA